MDVPVGVTLAIGSIMSQHLLVSIRKQTSQEVDSVDWYLEDTACEGSQISMYPSRECRGLGRVESTDDGSINS